MNDSINKIDISYFECKYKEDSKIPEKIDNKAIELKTKYNCLNSFYDPKMMWVKKNNIKKDKNIIPKSRFHIIIPDFNEDSILKRKLTGLLNKLTPKNKAIIYDSINEIINANSSNKDKIFDIIWDYIKSNDNDLYSNILAFFNDNYLKEKINEKWNNYINNKEWNPPNKIYDNNILLLNDEYDLYCDYVKWKKKINNLNNLWIKFKMNEINILQDEIYNHASKILAENTVYKHILDIFLEQLYKILTETKNKEIIDKIKSIDIQRFNNSTKFLLYNFYDL
tara:strand:+ start:17372 stop:18214 length:843 start_codon:yes stop_codon:yes gene_type:complete